MKYTENALNILTAKSYKGIGTAWIVKNLKGNEDVEKIVSLLNNTVKEKTNAAEFKYRKNDFEVKLLEKFDNECCDGIVALGDDDFPQYRGNVKESEQPIVLFYKGNIGLLDKSNLNVTVIGLLNPDEKIELSEKMVTTEILKYEVTIVSGLAFGCDSIAHKTALENGRKTIAILPSPLNNILPAKNKGLAFEIIEENGLLVTEYYEDFKTTMELSSCYKERDRLQALYCDAIVLAASYAQNSAQLHSNLYGQKLDSGARLAMGYAKEYGIKRAVIYHEEKHASSPMYDLNRQIIKEDGNKAIVIDSVNMIETVHKLLSSKNNSQSSLFW
jgi:DNA processing protein